MRLTSYHEKHNILCEEQWRNIAHLVVSSYVVTAVRRLQKPLSLVVLMCGPWQEEIVKVLEFIAKKESLQLPQGFAARIADKSNRSLRRAILSLETCRVQNFPFTANQVISPIDWEEYVAEIATDIMKEQSPKSLFQVRGKVYELIVNCIPPEVIFKRLLHELLKRLDSELKLEALTLAALAGAAAVEYYDHKTGATDRYPKFLKPENLNKD